MTEVRCPSCGNQEYEQRRVEYLYRHSGAYLLVPNTPAEVCTRCGTLYYAASVLKEIERRFFAIQEYREQPDRYLEIPEKAFV